MKTLRRLTDKEGDLTCISSISRDQMVFTSSRYTVCYDITNIVQTHFMNRVCSSVHYSTYFDIPLCYFGLP